jgi:hypothetical protein
MYSNSFLLKINIYKNFQWIYVAFLANADIRLFCDKIHN